MDAELSAVVLVALKRPTLQKLCKKYGLKANGKVSSTAKQADVDV